MTFFTRLRLGSSRLLDWNGRKCLSASRAAEDPDELETSSGLCRYGQRRFSSYYFPTHVCSGLATTGQRVSSMGSSSDLFYQVSSVMLWHLRSCIAMGGTTFLEKG